MKKRIAATLLALLLCSSLLTTVYAQTVSFSDVPSGHWGYSTIMRMTRDGLFKGTSEPVNGVGTFAPEKTMTRAEFVTSVLRAVYPEEAAKVQNVAGKWWLGYYHMALKYGLLFTGELGNGAMDQPMTRQEMAMVLVRALKILRESPEQLVKESQIADYASISDTYKNYVRECFSMGLIAGVDKQGTFSPTKSLTRAEAATVLCRLLYEEERAEVEFTDAKDEEKDKDQKPSNTKPSGSNKPSSGGSLSGGSNTGNSGSTGNSGNSGNSGNTGGNTTQPEEEDFRDTTWEAYAAMTEDEKNEFRMLFESDEDFQKWLEEHQEDIVVDEEEDPFEGKTLEDFTWKDYMKLNLLDAAAFREQFFGGDDAAFEEWANSYIGEAPDLGEEEDPFGGMELDSFTMDDYFEMDPVDQAAFCEQFFGGDQTALDEWIFGQIEMPDLRE